MASRQLLVNVAAFAVTEGQPMPNADVYNAVVWAPLSNTIPTGKLRAYFEESPAGDALAQALYDTLQSRGVWVAKNWY